MSKENKHLINNIEEAHRIADDYIYYRQYNRKAYFMYHLASGQAFRVLFVIELFAIPFGGFLEGIGLWTLIGFFSYTRGNNVINHYDHYKNIITQYMDQSITKNIKRRRKWTY